MLEIISGDIFDSKEKYLIHQCNCVTNVAAGFAKEVFEKYPYANIYKHRKIGSDPKRWKTRDKLGTINIQGNGIKNRYIIGLFSQYYPGKPMHKGDTREIRLDAFRKCLFEVSKIKDLESIACPYKIGCNLGGGIWEDYLKILENFANYIYQQQNAKVIIYKRD